MSESVGPATPRPDTEAGRRLLAYELGTGADGVEAERAMNEALGQHWEEREAILAIEAEARQQGAASERERWQTAFDSIESGAKDQTEYPNADPDETFADGWRAMRDKWLMAVEAARIWLATPAAGAPEGAIECVMCGGAGYLVDVTDAIHEAQSRGHQLAAIPTALRETNEIGFATDDPSAGAIPMTTNPSSALSPEREAELRANFEDEHELQSWYDEEGVEACKTCGVGWPCSAVELVRFLDAARSDASPRDEDGLLRHEPVSGEAGLREAAQSVHDSWFGGDLDNNYDRIASAFDGLRTALAAQVPEPCHVEPAFSQHEYAVAYCETHDQPADQCSQVPEPSLDAANETRRLLGYLWTATGRNSRVPISDMFDPNDSITEDVRRLAIFPESGRE